MTTDHALVLGWLVLAHLVADFLVQTDAMVADKFASGARAWRGLLTHGAVVALCMFPFALAYGGRGVAVLAVVAVAHVAIDRWKIRATRSAEARALARAHRRLVETPENPAALGPAWTPVPGALFAVDQLLHVAVIVGAWAVFVVPAPAPTPEWTAALDLAFGGADPEALHRATLTAVVVASLLVVNVRAGAMFVATLVSPREAVAGDPVAVPETDGEEKPLPAAWRVRVGPIVATAEPRRAAAGRDGGTTRAGKDEARGASPARIGATIGILERLLIVTFVLTNSTIAIGFVVGAKTLARFKQLDDRDFAEYYLLGTLASVTVALGSAMVAQAVLGTLPGS